MFDIVNAVCEWNEKRGNIKYNRLHEYRMLDEELIEYLSAYTDYDEADALADIIFVAIGSLYKLAAADEQKVYDILAAVATANNAKGEDKDENGKIIKHEGFKGPEEIIKDILKET